VIAYELAEIREQTRDHLLQKERRRQTNKQACFPCLWCAYQTGGLVSLLFWFLSFRQEKCMKFVYWLKFCLLRRAVFHLPVGSLTWHYLGIILALLFSRYFSSLLQSARIPTIKNYLDSALAFVNFDLTVKLIYSLSNLHAPDTSITRVVLKSWKLY
jgi:uncharacterized protein YacL